ncbi:hypothetical protein WP50_04525, partial [Lactiplantibacillus plantarum]
RKYFNVTSETVLTWMLWMVVVQCLFALVMLAVASWHIRELSIPLGIIAVLVKCLWKRYDSLAQSETYKTRELLLPIY